MLNNLPFKLIKGAGISVPLLRKQKSKETAGKKLKLGSYGNLCGL